MYYAATQQMNTTRHIVRSARREIKQKTGMSINMMLYTPGVSSKTPGAMLDVIALSLGMSPDNYRLKSRERHVVELRFVAAVLLRSNFPFMTLQQIAMLFGGQDHSSVISGLARAHDLIYIGDARFVKKYNTAQKAVDIWLKDAEYMSDAPMADLMRA